MLNIKRIGKTIATGAGSAALALLYVQNTFAGGLDNVNMGVSKTNDAAGGLTVSKVIDTVTNILLFAAGALAVIMLIYGGIRYITSHGDKDQIKAAKETITYSIAGLVIAIAAYAVVQFIVLKLKKA